MKLRIIHLQTSILIFCIFVLAGSSFSQSLYEEYTNKSVAELKAETQEMSREIVTQFDPESIDMNRQKIHFFDYFSNFKKMMLYGAKLSTYADFEEDLKFARENELFKGLPEKEAEEDKNNRKRFVSEKYKMMHTNIKDEINTYTQLIKGSLDSCEQLALYELKEAGVSEENEDRVRYFIETSKTAQTYFEKQSHLAKRWPILETRINHQIKLWQKKGLAPEDPIIDIKITKAIRNDGSV